MILNIYICMTMKRKTELGLPPSLLFDLGLLSYVLEVELSYSQIRKLYE